MKKLLLIIVSIFIISGCKSREEKAAELIKKDLLSQHNISGYEAVETKIDSAFISAHTDSIILNLANRINTRITDEAELYLLKLKEKESLINLFKTSGLTNSDELFIQAAYEFKDYSDKLSACYKTMQLDQDSIIERAKTLSKDFSGWQVSHAFKFNGDDGESYTADYIYVFDKDFNKILYSANINDENYISVKSLIDEALDMDNNNVKTQIDETREEL
ncbi:hypothetical protein [Bacteroides thetaiotaomicron]|jgi:hypothetical protein|uniref:hypothetical protein n=1 Tax=Bacteroides thetaiotaomicron TaxID=818 RepID=UPI001F3CB539|nr:hypothetical protein [Bacteroides thetaiotaomicron]MCE8994383.1 hypothetical protein [Bacteroides thetaiotaomicron]